jgi:hypothetical protein
MLQFVVVVVGCVPLSQKRHCAKLMWSEADVAASTRWRPEGQFEQLLGVEV